MDLQIKRITLANWQEFKQIRLEAFKCEPTAFGTQLSDAIGYPDSYWLNMVGDSNNIIFVAVAANQVVGVMRAAISDPEVPKDTAFIGSAYVNKDFRRRGIAKQLMTELIAEITKVAGIWAIRLWVNEKQSNALKFYDNFGFVRVGEDLKAKELILEKVL